MDNFRFFHCKCGIAILYTELPTETVGFRVFWELNLRLERKMECCNISHDGS